MAILLGNDQMNTLTGTNGVDAIYGFGGDDGLHGRAGADLLVGGDGNDLLVGGAGADTLIGGSGSDLASYTQSSTFVKVDLSTGKGTGGDAQGDILSGIEQLEGSAHGDTLIGNSSANRLLGGAGADRLEGRGGNDVYDGGSGADTVDFGWLGAPSSDRHTIDLGNASVFKSIENLSGSGFSDFVQGTTGANALFGKDGDDILEGKGRADILDGGAGYDVLVGGAGADMLIGGPDGALADYTGSNAAVQVDLQQRTAGGGHAAGDWFVGITDLVGSAFDDVLTGDGGGNLLESLDGDDVLAGGGGADRLRGGMGRDELTGGAGGDRFVFWDADESLPGLSMRDVITDFSKAQGDKIELFDNLTFVGQAAFSGENQISVQYPSSGDTLVQVNTVGTSGAEMEILLKGIVFLSASDFVAP